MATYIEREAAAALLEEKLRDICPLGRCSRNAVYGTDRDLYDAIESDIDALNNIPAADVVEVRHGRWERLGESHENCTNCGSIFEALPTQYFFEMNNKFCRMCGAKMDGE